MDVIARSTIVLLWWILAGCGDDPHPPPPRAARPVDAGAPREARRALPRAYAYAASRCGECHEPAYSQWEGSPHAMAARAPAFVAMRNRRSDQAECVRCHAPMSPWVAPRDPIAAEGVTCDACHAADSVNVDAATGRIHLRADDNVKYGPLCNVPDHYFHRMGCSELHTSARFCAGCHHLVRNVGGTEIPIYSEFAEWSAGPYAEEETQCQSCHMPETAGPAATGSAERDDLSHHGYFGTAGDLRSRALGVRVRGSGTDDRVALSIDLRNRRAGHRVPSGMPGRRIVVRARAIGPNDAPLAQGEATLGRVLVDAQGREAPHHEAVRLASDDRIAPRETRTLPIELVVPDAAEIVVTVSWREMSDELARQLHLGAPREQLLAEARLRVGPPRPRRRVGRARLVSGAPP